MESLFTSLSQAVEGALPIALAASFVWGVLSIILSPCHLGSIPLIVGFISGQGNLTTRRAFSLATVFALGILATIAIIGIITAGLGRMMGDVGVWGNYFVAVIFFAVGLYLLEVIPQFGRGIGNVKLIGKGLWSALLLGLIFGVALGPCTFAYMAPMLAVAFRLGTTNLLDGALLLAMYGVGHCSVIILAGTFTSAVQRYLNWSGESRGMLWLKRICGVMVILAGIYFIYTAG